MGVMKNKKAVLSFLILGFLVLIFSVVMIVAATPESETITKAADRMIVLQNSDGSWDWVVTDATGPTGTTYRNIAGVNAEVLLDAYSLTGDTDYLDAAENAGDYILSFPISEGNRYNAFNIVFLYHLADASGDLDYSDHADDLMNHILNEENYWSNHNGNYCGTTAGDNATGCTASELTDAIINFRSSYPPYPAWDLYNFVEAGQRYGDTTFADNIATEIKDFWDTSSFDSSDYDYILGLSGVILALEKAGMDSSSYVTDLLAEQESDGHFETLDPDFGESHVQATAYALMALKSAGEQTDVNEAASYLLDEFEYDGYDGWLEYDDDEYSEVTSECAQALFEADHENPVASDLVVEKLSEQCKINIEALITDEASFIEEAEYFLGTAGCGTPGTGTSMNAEDGYFDELIEEVIVNNVGVSDGSLNIHVQGKDAAGHWSNCISIQKNIDCLPSDYPTCEEGDTSSGIAINGICNPNELLVCGNNPTLTASICDDESSIQLAEYFLDLNCKEGECLNWNGIYMDASDGTYYDELCEDVIAIIDLSQLFEGTHTVNLHGKDSQENWGKFNEVAQEVSFIKDTTEPKTEKTLNPFDQIAIDCTGQEYTLPEEIEGLTNGCAYVKTGTTITLDANDFNPDDDTNEGYNDNPGEYAGLENTYYKIWYSYDCNTKWIEGDVTPYTGTITLNEDSCHLIEYWSVDNCGYIEDHHYELDIVDTQAPIVTKEIIGPQYYDEQEEKLYLDGRTLINLTCIDQEPHPVDDVTIYYRYFLDGQLVQDWIEYQGPFGFPEESQHRLEYYCVDALGNSDGTTEQPYVEIDYVDHTPPITTKTYGTPLVEDPTGAYPKWINSSTLITLTADDPDTTGYGCNSGVAETKYRVTLVNDKACWTAASGCSTYDGDGEWEDYDGSFTIDEESCHLIEYWSVDNVEKTEVIKKQCVFVDNTPPITTKIVGEPKVLCDESPNSGEWCTLDDNINDYWVTQDTEITLTCSDAEQPHPVDHEKLCYKISYDEPPYLTDNYCELYGGTMEDDWCCLSNPQQLYTIEFTEDCLHDIEYYCVDKLGNKETTKVEYDNVDTEGPIVIRKYARVNGGEIIEGGIEGQEVEIAITSDDTIKLCAELEDIKQTEDIGVGIDEVFYELVGLPDPQLNWDSEEGAYCVDIAGSEIQDDYLRGDCGKWRFEVQGTDLLGNQGEWTNGLTVIVDNVAPMGEVLNPHAGNYYRDGVPFQVYAPAVDFGGDYCSLCGNGYNEDCPASGVDYCDLYAIDYNFENMSQEEIKNCYSDLWKYFQNITANPNIVYLGRVPYEDGVCKGTVSLPEDSGLTDTVFLGIDYVDKAGNQGNEIFGYHLQLALNPWFSPITMNIDNDGPLVYVEDSNLPGPVTSAGDGDNIYVEASIDDGGASGFDDCRVDIYTNDEGKLGEYVGQVIGAGIDFDTCRIDGAVPELESGDYLVEVIAVDEEFNSGSQILSMEVDNLYPDLNVVSPKKNGVYGEIFPVSLLVEDSQSNIADETVVFRINSDAPSIWNVWCILGTCEDSGWVTLPIQDNGLYATSINLSEYGITGEKGTYYLGAYACDNLYVVHENPDHNDGLGWEYGDPRNLAHCRSIADAEEESRTQCNDGIDNDLDGYIDLFDGSCSSSEDDDESANDCDLDEDGHLNVGCGGSDCNDNNPDSWRVGSFYVDMDFDGYHHFGEENYDPETDMLAICYGAEIPSGFSETTLGRDCDDSNGAVNPGATEICDNSIDDDCDGDVDYSDSDCPS